MQAQTQHPGLQGWQRLVGTWATEATHPALPGTAVTGQATFEWLEDQRFLIWRSHYDHPEIPDAIAVTGIIDGKLSMQHAGTRRLTVRERPRDLPARGEIRRAGFEPSLRPGLGGRLRRDAETTARSGKKIFRTDRGACFRQARAEPSRAGLIVVAVNRMPAADVEVSADLVRRLLADQHPDLARLSVEFLANGWDNELYRVGDRLVARLPRRALGAQIIKNEQRWLPGLAPRLPLPIPYPERTGVPACGYPYPWSVVRYLPGVPAAQAGSFDLEAAGAAVGGFLGALHVPAPADAPTNPSRGVPLAERAGTFAGLAAGAGGTRVQPVPAGP
jgi:hypothetical protein